MPSSLPKESEHPFKLGELVLCRYGDYPYWPATVDITHQKHLAGKHVTMHRTKKGDRALAFWCTFMNDECGGWVRADRMIRYHPELGKKVIVDGNHSWHDDQKEALDATEKLFSDMPKTPEESKPPKISSDLQRYIDDKTGICEADDKNDLEPDEDDDTEEEVKHLVTAGNSKSMKSPVRRRTHGDDDPMDLGDTSDEDNILKSKESPAQRKTTKRRRSSVASQEPVVKRKRGRPPADSQTPGKRGRKKTKKVDGDVSGTPKSTTPRQESKDNQKEERNVRKGKSKNDASSAGVEHKSARKKGRPVGSKNGGMNGDTARVNEDLNRKLEQAEDELREAREKIVELQMKLDKASNHSEGPSDTLMVFTSPKQPERIEKELPPDNVQSSEPIAEEDFVHSLDSLKELFESYQTLVDEAKVEREALDTEKRDMIDSYTKRYTKIVDIENKIPKSELEVVSKLEHILTSTVSVEDMRKVFAGKKIMRISKASEGRSEAICSFSTKICQKWIAQIRAYGKENKIDLSKNTNKEQDTEKDEEAKGEKGDSDNKEQEGSTLEKSENQAAGNVETKPSDNEAEDKMEVDTDTGKKENVETTEMATDEKEASKEEVPENPSELSKQETKEEAKESKKELDGESNRKDKAEGLDEQVEEEMSMKDEKNDNEETLSEEKNEGGKQKSNEETAKTDQVEHK